ncbi:plasmid replication initiator TrfA [Nitrosococcus watsonii]|nr:plasmid replication initiator TrfA [Nitrosococcus watsonii]
MSLLIPPSNKARKVGAKRRDGVIYPLLIFPQAGLPCTLRKTTGNSSLEKAVEHITNKIARMAQEAKTRREAKAKREAETAKIIPLLPCWDKGQQRGVPNEMVRSALFSVKNKKQARAYLEGVPIVVVGDGRISYRGQELRQDDEDVWLQIMHEAKARPLGKCVEFKPYALLKGVGWAIKGQSYQRLQISLERMVATALTVSSHRLGKSVTLPLIQKFGRAHGGGPWKVWISSEMVVLFGDVHYTRLEWEMRHQLGPIAKWLHGLYSRPCSTLSDEGGDLWKGSGSADGLLKTFKANLKGALNELQAVGFLSDWRIEGNLVYANLKGALNELQAVGFLSDWRIEGNLVYVVRAEKKT